MFNRDLFEYDPSTHIGKYEGKVVPSVTQLLDILYPYSEDIPQERLKAKAEYGTKVHNAIEKINTYFDNPFGFDHNIEVVREVGIGMSKALELNELVDYVSFLSAYKLQPFDYEELIFLLDEQGELICFGHYDCTFLSQGDIGCFEETKLYLCDFKTTSLLDKRKVKLQENIYAVAYEQCSRNPIENVFCLWFDEPTKLVPLGRFEKDYVINMAKLLRDQWQELQGE